MSFGLRPNFTPFAFASAGDSVQAAKSSDALSIAGAPQNGHGRSRTGMGNASGLEVIDGQLRIARNYVQIIACYIW